jgi:hypothetical protein
MTISSARNIKLDIDRLNIYGLGGYGTGKSVFASTFPTPGFVFDFDQRIKTYRGKDWDYATFDLSGKGWVEFETAFREVQKRCKDGKYKTVVLDSTTSMTDCAMERALQLDPKRSSEGGALWNVHFNIVKNLVEPKLHGILSLPPSVENVIMLGHWQIVTDAKTGVVISVDPLLTGNLSAKVPGYFDEIYAFFSDIREGKEKFYFRTLTHGHYKSRSTISGAYKLLPKEINNNYTEFLTHLQKAMELEAEIIERRDKQQEAKTEGE